MLRWHIFAQEVCMAVFVGNELIETIRSHAHPLSGDVRDYDRLMEAVGDARLVLLGEATHGTHEFYRERARITQRLIEEKHFCGIVVEADWPDAYRVNRYVRGLSEDSDPDEALSGFRRFPTWMWRNADIVKLIGWLREHNNRQKRYEEKAGFYGMDLYSLYASIEAVLGYLSKVDAAAADRARRRYSCFEHFQEDSQAYGYSAASGITEPCEDEVVRELIDLQRRAADYSARDGRLAEDEYFFAEQNARLIKNAEQYYRSMFRGRVSSWNLRDRHMVETLEALMRHLERNGNSNVRLVVWAHNSHLGDARATHMGEIGELNVGQLVREQHGSEAVLVGFITFEGTVSAASEWDGPVEFKRVRPALAGSYEALMHQAGVPKFLLNLRDSPELGDALRSQKEERAIGVIYRPETERLSHYFDARLSDQFDLLLHFDRTRAVEPLERSAEWHAGEVPETFPSGV
jgi:erythromycin esterase-like protein